MANPATYNGMKAIGHRLGIPLETCLTTYVTADSSNDLYPGDLVKWSGTADATTKLPTVLRAEAGDAACGVIASVDIDTTAPYSNKLYATANTTRTVKVYSDPNVIYEAHMNGAFAVTDVNNIANVVYGTANATFGRSGLAINSTGIGTGDNVRIIGISSDPKNEIGNYAKVLVVINDSQVNATAAI